MTPGLTALEDQLIRAHGVADIGEVALRLEIADRDLRLAASFLDVGDAAGEARRDELWILSRTEMVERTGDR